MNIKKIKTLLVLLSFLAYMPLTAIQAVAADLPVIDGTINGTVTNPNSDTLNAQVNGGTGAVAQFDWKEFNVGAGKTVNWEFTNWSQTAINRVLGNNLSQIYGNLTNSSSSASLDYASTGKVILINPSGILFGNGSSVNLNSFTASTYDLQGMKNVGTAGYGAADLDKFSANTTKMYNFVGNADAGGIIADNANIFADKSLALVGKDITVYNGSKLATNLNYNYTSNGVPQSFSNIKLITGNGVDFQYAVNGYIRNEGVDVKQGATDVDYNIVIDNAYIDSGDVFIKNRGMTNGVDSGIGSDISINKSAIKGYKLVNNSFGDIYVVGNNKVNIKDSTLTTYNTTNNDVNSNPVSTSTQEGGDILVRGGQGVWIDNSILKTAYSTNQSNVVNEEGHVTLDSTYGYVWVDASSIDSRGNIKATAAKDVVIMNSQLVARNSINAPGIYRDILISGKNVELGNNVIDASRDVTIKANNGNVEIDRNPVINAGNTLSIFGNNTLINDSLLSYYSLVFVNPVDPNALNNVTIQGNATFNDKTSPDHLVLTTNGNLTLDNATLKKDDYTVASGVYTRNNTPSNQKQITLNSTKGGVEIKNSSNVATQTGDFTVNSSKNIDVNNSTIASAANINLNATAGDINVTNNSSLDAASGLNVLAKNTLIDNSNLAYNSVKFFDAVAHPTLENNVTVSGTSRITDKSQTGLTLVTNGDLTFSDNIIVRKDGTDNSQISLKGKNVNLASARAATTTGNITVEATTGDIELSGNSVLETRAGDINLTASQGSNTIRNISQLLSANDINILQAKKFDAFVGNTGTGIRGGSITSGKNITITTTDADADITMDNAALNTRLSYSNLTLNAGRDNVLSDAAALNVKNVNLNAAGKNTITGGNDVTLNNVNLGAATTVTSTTGSVYTGATSQSASGSPGALFTDFKVVGTGKVNTNNNALVVNATNGDVNMVIQGATNTGITVNAKGTTTVTADGGQLAIARIETGKLNLNTKDTFKADASGLKAGDSTGLNDYAPTNSTTNAGNPAGRGVIIIKDKDGFNLDSPAAEVAVGGIYESSYQFNNTNDTYLKHFINLNAGGDFLLSYAKPYSNGGPPPVPPEDTPGGLGADDISPALSSFRIPLQSQLLGTPGPILNNLTDPIPGLVAAAAGITLEDEEELLY